MGLNCAVSAVAVMVALSSCTSSADAPSAEPAPTPTTSAAESATSSSTPEPTATPEAVEETAPALPPSAGRPAMARLSIPALGIDNLRVVPYVGWTDDAPGTLIQNRGMAASPHGRRGGVGPGGIGNYQVTAHRLSSTRAFEFVPDLRRGDRVVVRTRHATYVYRISTTRETSFRSPASLRAQRAAVPGRPGATPTRAMITLSTCATPEDHAAGNYWSDEFKNPEHRIDKIGVLVAWRER
jgi:sortase A